MADLLPETLDILLATYNGEAYLQEQLDSLLNQDFRDWRLLVRDDGSSDETAEILEAYASKFSHRIRVVPNHGANLGIIGNFSELMRNSDAEYFMFCDQDDLWLPEKVRLTLKKMKEMEAACGPGIPLLVHTDLRIVDASLDPVVDSGHRFQQIDPVKGDTLSRLLVQNIATGCTIMMNRALRDLALPIPGAALMHDHWLSLVAACFGKIAYLPRPTLLYRQHGGNKVGAQGWSPGYAVRLLLQLPALRQMMVRNRGQAKAFYEQYRPLLKSREKAMLQAFFDMPEHGLLQKRLDILRYGFFYSGAVRNLGWLLLC